MQAVNYQRANQLDRLTKSCATNLPEADHTVNAVAPGFIVTDMTDELSDKVKSH